MTVASVIDQAITEMGYGAGALLADLCEVSPAAVTSWRQGARLPNPRKWHRIEQHLHLEAGTIAAEVAKEEG